MSGFDVSQADTRRARMVVVLSSVLLSAFLLFALISARSVSDASEPPVLAEQDVPEAQADLDTAGVAELDDDMGRSTQTSDSEPLLSSSIALQSTAPTLPLERLNQNAFRDCPDCDAISNASLTVPRGGTLAGVLDDAGAGRREAARAIYALGDLFDVRDLRVGQAIQVYLRDSEDEDGEAFQQLDGLSFRPDIERTITVARLSDGSYRARETRNTFSSEWVRASGTITSSLYVDALQAGATDRVVVELAGVLGYAIDFQRSIYPGDGFDLLFERFIDADGDVARTGDIVYARYDGRGEPKEFFRFETPDGIVGYYTGDGASAQRLLMLTPINGARLSSHFGRRRHPILGYTRAHNGTDFAAPTGTPIMAAGNGVVERANRFGSFGNYIRIRHPNGYQTAYAHLNGFARGIRAGSRVTQGQIIGYVGTTGRSTGPHLHYEVHLNGSPVNPMTLDLPTGRQLEDDELPLFEAERDRILAMLETAASAAEADDTLMASNQDGAQ